MDENSIHVQILFRAVSTSYVFDKTDFVYVQIVE